MAAFLVFVVGRRSAVADLLVVIACDPAVDQYPKMSNGSSSRLHIRMGTDPALSPIRGMSMFQMDAAFAAFRPAQDCGSSL